MILDGWRESARNVLWYFNIWSSSAKFNSIACYERIIEVSLIASLLTFVGICKHVQNKRSSVLVVREKRSLFLILLFIIVILEEYTGEATGC